MDFAAGMPCGGALMRPRQRHEPAREARDGRGGWAAQEKGMMRRRGVRYLTRGAGARSMGGGCERRSLMWVDR